MKKDKRGTFPIDFTGAALLLFAALILGILIYIGIKYGIEGVLDIIRNLFRFKIRV